MDIEISDIIFFIPSLIVKIALQVGDSLLKAALKFKKAIVVEGNECIKRNALFSFIIHILLNDKSRNYSRGKFLRNKFLYNRICSRNNIFNIKTTHY